MQTALKERAGRRKARLAFDIDPEFSLLHPLRRHRDNWEAAERRRRESASKLALRWIRRTPQKVATQLRYIEDEATLAGLGYPDLTSFASSRLSEEVSEALPWLDAFMSETLDGSALWPLLVTAAKRNEPGWQDRAYSCLETNKWAELGAHALLTTQSVGQDDIDRVAALGARIADTLGQLCWFSNTDDVTVLRLLECGVPEIAAAVAQGLWRRKEPPGISDALWPAWTKAVVAHLRDEHTLCEIVRKYPDVASKYLLDRMHRPDNEFFHEDHVIQDACSAVSWDTRNTLIGTLSASYMSGIIAGFLVGQDEVLFRALLAQKGLQNQHLAPLKGRPDDGWARRAILAVEAGHSPREVAGSAFSETHVFSGPLSGHYQARLNAWKALVSHSDPRIRAVIEVGLRTEQDNLRRAQAREQRSGAYRELSDW